MRYINLRLTYLLTYITPLTQHYKVIHLLSYGLHSCDGECLISSDSGSGSAAF